MRTNWLAAFVAITACGGVEQITSDASIDVIPHDSTTDHDDANVGFGDAADVATPPDAYVDCTDGGYFITLDDDAGSHVFDAGCGNDGDTPAVFDIGCGHKNVCPEIAACGGGEIVMTTFGFEIPETSGVGVTVTQGDASALYAGTVYASDWPVAIGATFGGKYVATLDASSISGTFCVRRR